MKNDNLTAGYYDRPLSKKAITLEFYGSAISPEINPVNLIAFNLKLVNLC